MREQKNLLAKFKKIKCPPSENSFNQPFRTTRTLWVAIRHLIFIYKLQKEQVKCQLLMFPRRYFVVPAL